MGRYFRRYSEGRVRRPKKKSARVALSHSVGGIDRDIEHYFLHLTPQQLDAVLRRYGQENGPGALTYAIETYGSWRRGGVKMSGLVAQRLLNLVPLVLDSSTRFELVKKLRYRYMRKQTRWVSCAPADWRAKVAPVIAELLAASSAFQLPGEPLERLHWLAHGDTAAAQALLAAAEQEEAVVRLAHLEGEFQRIDLLLQTIASTRSVSHDIHIPQGSIHVTIAIPEPKKKGFWQTLGELFS